MLISTFFSEKIVSFQWKFKAVSADANYIKKLTLLRKYILKERVFVFPGPWSCPWPPTPICIYPPGPQFIFVFNPG